MRGKHVRIELDGTTRSELEKHAKTGKSSVKLVARAKIILELDESDGRKPLTQARIAEKLGVSRQTVNEAKQAFIIAGNSVSGFLQRKKRETPPVAAKITGEVEARIIALACSQVPGGRAKWGVRLLADKCVELNSCLTRFVSPSKWSRAVKRRLITSTNEKALAAFSLLHSRLQDGDMWKRLNEEPR